MNLRIAILIMTLLITMAGTARADLVTFSDTLLGGIGDGIKEQINSSSSEMFELNILSHGYVPTKYTLISAILNYTFFDTDNPEDPVVMLTGITDGGLEIFRTTLDLSNKKNGASTYSGNYSFSTGNLKYLSDGLLTLEISSSKTIDVDQLRLEVKAESTPVPLPGAVWFLGSGILGLATYRRKKANRV